MPLNQSPAAEKPQRPQRQSLISSMRVKREGVEDNLVMISLYAEQGKPDFKAYIVAHDEGSTEKEIMRAVLVPRMDSSSGRKYMSGKLTSEDGVTVLPMILRLTHIHSVTKGSFLKAELTFVEGRIFTAMKADGGFVNFNGALQNAFDTNNKAGVTGVTPYEIILRNALDITDVKNMINSRATAPAEVAANSEDDIPGPGM